MQDSLYPIQQDPSWAYEANEIDDQICISSNLPCRSYVSKFGERLDDCCIPTQTGCSGDTRDCIEGLCDDDHGSGITWDMSSVQATYDEALKTGREGNDAFHRCDYGDAILAYKRAIGLIDMIQMRVCHGTMRFNQHIDTKMTSITFTILVNTAACFLYFEAYDRLDVMEGQVGRSRYEEAIECTKAAVGVYQHCQKEHPLNCWRPSAAEWTRACKVSAAAWQRMGNRDQALQYAQQALQYSPCDEVCRRYVEQHTLQMARPLDVQALSEKLEDLLEEAEDDEESCKDCIVR